MIRILTCAVFILNLLPMTLHAQELSRTQTKAVAKTDKSSSQTVANRSPSELGSALQCLFKPTPIRSVRTMGSMQRTSMLDDLLKTRKQLEIAILIDGTESMAPQLQGVREMLVSMIKDLRTVVGDKLSIQILVYRDVGAESGAVSWPLPIDKKAWATDYSKITEGLEKIIPESGAPYFYELVDVGLYAALHDLSWSEDPSISRWLFLIGDAPPFKPGFSEPENKASRVYDNNLLVRMAQDKQVQIFGILCPARPEDLSIQEELLPECRQFFSAMADATGGFVLDLSDADQLKQLQHAADEATKQYVEFPMIRPEDIDTFRNAANPQEIINIGVLPFFELKDMTFEVDNSLVQLAEEVRSRLDKKGVQTPELRSVKNRFEEIKRNHRNAEDSVLAQKLAEKLQVDYLICRKPSSSGELRIAAFSRRTGKLEPFSHSDDLVAKSNELGKNPVELAGTVIEKLQALTLGSNSALERALTSRNSSLVLVSTTNKSSSILVQARLLLQRAQKYAAIENNNDDLDAALEILQLGAQELKADPLWNNMMATVLYNLSNSYQRDDPAKAKEFVQKAILHSELAAQSGNDEFVADHSFFKGDHQKAIEMYELVTKKSVSSDAICRSHWMLTFLYLGDWGTPKNLRSYAKAREHVVALFAMYPDREEAKTLKQLLRWNDEEGIQYRSLSLEAPSPSDLIQK